MLLLVLLIIQVRLGDFNCDTCITQPLWLWSEKSDCPVCSIDGEKYVLENCDSDLCNKPYLDYHNPNNWTTCNMQRPICDDSVKYRSIDGSCNNLDNPTWGMANTVFTRILPAHYRDGKRLIRLAQCGEPLPLARKLTTDVFTSGDESEEVSSMASSWGQVVAHDLVYTKAPTGSWDCCQMLNENKCFPLEYPTDDYFFSQFNVTCENFLRNDYSTVGEDCRTGTSHQINFNTHTLDGSVIYGSDRVTSDSLRSFTKGLLKSRKIQDGREFLPNVRIDQENTCKRSKLKEPCYTAGDSRVNANTGLSTLQVLLQRSHNNIARKLSQLHVYWSDEKLFQESRRIVIAIYQHITYKEWLPLYIGNQIADEAGLIPCPDSFIDYNKLININLLNSFVAGAFRIGHSGIRNDFKLFDRQHEVSGKVSLNEWMHRPVVIEKGNNYDQFVLGLVNHPMQFIDHIFSTEYSNRFNHGTKPYGSDMVSTDILRGRDHGLAPYTSYLKTFIGVHITSFNDLIYWMSAKHIPKLQRVYKSVDDIDLLVGGALEKHVYGSKLGPTFLAITAEQFYRLKFGDRFFYEVGNQPHSFTRAQLNQIKKMTLSKFICDNADGVTTMPKDSFHPVSASNVPVPCHNIPGIDLEYF